MKRTFFVIQNSADPNIFYKEKRGSWTTNHGHAATLVETTFKDAKKFKSIKEIHNSLEKYFNNKLKGHISDLSSGFKIIRHTEEVIVSSKEEALTDETSALINDVVSVSKMVKDTHYSTIELFNKIRKDPNLSEYKYILSTPYDRLSTSQLMVLFESHELNPIKYKGNFAFDKEEYWTAAKLLCDVPFKSFNLTE
ncbi:MAG: hypothetical protein M0R77_02965 [Gammaproteobacteria bacterium]|nr:hypothetical protein [Gammaproteobacteria bacterium]